MHYDSEIDKLHERQIKEGGELHSIEKVDLYQSYQNMAFLPLRIDRENIFDLMKRILTNKDATFSDLTGHENYKQYFNMDVYAGNFVEGKIQGLFNKLRPKSGKVIT